MGGYNNCIMYEIILVKKKREMKKVKKSKGKKVKTKCYWFLEKNVKRLLENEDNVFADWISAGKELKRDQVIVEQCLLFL